MVFIRCWIIILVGFLVIIPEVAQAQKLRVVTRDLEPFSFEKDGRRVGYAMELWNEIAREAGMEYEVTKVSTAQEMIDALVEKRADVGVGALSVTSSREQIIDFTQPFYNSGLQIVVAGGESDMLSSIKELLGGLFNWKLMGALLLLLTAMVLISHLVWRFEHKTNEEMWPKTYRHGMWESFWWTICTLLVGGADNKGPVGVGGRIVAIVWMLLSIVLVSFLTASFTSTLTVNTLKGDIQGPGDLPDKSVATIGGSTSETWLKAKGAQVTPLADIAACIAALKKGDVEAVVYDAPILQYALNRPENESLQIAGSIFENQNYAFALQRDSTIRKPINQALLGLIEGGFREDLRKKWFGVEE